MKPDVTAFTRIEAAQLLAEKLSSFKGSKGIVLAIPRGGVLIAYHLSRRLQLPLEIIPCKKIPHPGDRSVAIGSVSLSEVVLNEFYRDIPQDYIAYQVRSMQQHMRSQCHQYKKPGIPDVKDKTVILVDDHLKTPDSILACLKGIQKQHPRCVVVAVPVATFDARLQISREVNDFVCLHTVALPEDIPKFFDEPYNTGDEDVMNLISMAEV